MNHLLDAPCFDLSVHRRRCDWMQNKITCVQGDRLGVTCTLVTTMFDLTAII
jgi:hypothetical protein